MYTAIIINSLLLLLFFLVFPLVPRPFVAIGGHERPGYEGVRVRNVWESYPTNVELGLYFHLTEK